MKIQRSISLTLLVLLLTGCKTTFYKDGATDEDFQRDSMLSQGYAASQVQDATRMPAQNGAEALIRTMTMPFLKKSMYNKSMKDLGWEK